MVKVPLSFTFSCAAHLISGGGEGRGGEGGGEGREGRGRGGEGDGGEEERRRGGRRGDEGSRCKRITILFSGWQMYSTSYAHV